MQILRQIAKHAAIIVLPEAFLLGVFTAMTLSPESDFDGGIVGKTVAQVCFGGVAVIYALVLIYFYFKWIEKKCRTPREIEFVEMQPVRMRPFYHPFPRHAPPDVVLQTNGHLPDNEEERNDDDDSDVSEELEEV